MTEGMINIKTNAIVLAQPTPTTAPIMRLRFHIAHVRRARTSPAQDMTPMLFTSSMSITTVQESFDTGFPKSRNR